MALLPVASVYLHPWTQKVFLRTSEDLLLYQNKILIVQINMCFIHRYNIVQILIIYTVTTNVYGKQ